MLFAGLEHQAQVHKTISVISEDIRFSISSLKYMVWPTGYNNTWKSQ